MRVIATEAVAELVRDRGGQLYVWPDHQRCCQGATHLIAASTPAPGWTFRFVEGIEGFALWFDPGNLTPPDELHLDVKGWRSKRVEAYWNGCVFVA